MQRIKLLLVITKLELGGAQKQLLSLISELDKGAFEIFLFTAQEGLLLPEAESLKGIRVKKSRYLERAINPFKDIAAFFEIRRFIKENNIDIVHTHSSKAGIVGRLAARAAGIENIVHTVHGWSFNDYQPPALKNIFVLLERITAGFTRRIIVVCHSDKRRGLTRHIGEEGKYSLIPYAIRHDDFKGRNEKAREALGLAAGDLAVGMVACLKPQKSPQDFMKLACLSRGKAAGIKFVLVGDGALRDDVKRLIASSNLENNVILTGWRRDIARLLSALDVFVLTSRWEGLPVAVLEAMAASLPLLISDTGGIREIVRNGQEGFLFASGDVKEAHAKLGLLLEDESLRRRMGEAASRRVREGFYLAPMVNRHATLYSELLRQQTGYVH
ncbi:MAG: glycosyltransferase family 4 protein [Candidatus Omnitrophota bacterium]